MKHSHCTRCAQHKLYDGVQSDNAGESYDVDEYASSASGDQEQSASDSLSMSDSDGELDLDATRRHHRQQPQKSGTVQQQQQKQQQQQQQHQHQQRQQQQASSPTLPRSHVQQAQAARDSQPNPTRQQQVHQHQNQQHASRQAHTSALPDVRFEQPPVRKSDGWLSDATLLAMTPPSHTSHRSLVESSFRSSSPSSPSTSIKPSVALAPLLGVVTTAAAPSTSVVNARPVSPRAASSHAAVVGRMLASKQLARGVAPPTRESALRFAASAVVSSSSSSSSSEADGEVVTNATTTSPIASTPAARVSDGDGATMTRSSGSAKPLPPTPWMTFPVVNVSTSSVIATPVVATQSTTATTNSTAAAAVVSTRPVVAAVVEERDGYADVADAG